MTERSDALLGVVFGVLFLLSAAALRRWGNPLLDLRRASLSGERRERAERLDATVVKAQVAVCVLLGVALTPYNLVLLLRTL